jgi:hypothetical protein
MPRHKTFLELEDILTKIIVNKYEYNNGCLSGSIMQLRRYNKQIWRVDETILGRGAP